MQGAELRDGEAAAAAAASYRVLSRLLGYGEAAPEPGPPPPPPPGHGPPPPPFLARPGPRGSRPPQLMVFRNVGRPPEEEDAEAAPEPGPSELLCPRHRCALDPKVLPPGLALERTWGPAAGLEAQLAALGLGQPAGPGVKTIGGGCCPCPCPPQPSPPQPQPPAAAPQAGEDPTETSDALLVLEGLESEAESLETNSCSEEELSSPGRGGGGGGRLLLQPPGPELPLVPLPLQDLVPPGRLSRGEQQQPPPPPPPPPGPLRPLAGPSRKGSLKIRLSRLFRTKSCNGGTGGGDGASKRPSGDLAASAASLTDVGGSAGRELDAGRKPRLTRTQSAFSPVSFSPLFTGETVSLVDVDISQRGLTSPHPPTPPPPPRRSLSLLDAFPRVAPIRAAESLHSQPPQHLQCPLYRPDSSSFAASLRELEKCGWYWGPMNWEDAEMKLKGKPDGSFLVRDSSDPRYILSLSFRSQGITHHTRMEHYRGTFSLWCHPKFEDRCQSVVEFIKRAIMHSKNGKFLYFLRSRVPGLPPTPVQLLYPVSRFSNVKSLQHLCRFRIRQLVRIDHIPDLPLPKPLISYIRKFYYYDPQEEVYLSLKEAQLISKQKQAVEPST
ncbi:PREDICTED: suppressor of cytokine signaling 7 isoform X2 [Hipposideros armiger]|uniref:Suppressor of cytokine signaling 7 n=1 Tax=Hipposideros armiger TaxID=186990 RepID=A0A8B7R2Q0_HIPAR|nr:PREDICTED: suppressor of cytokine signaling 7 isoform X2 [Hipposideros armiger]